MDTPTPPTVIAFDPGVTTGVCIATPTDVTLEGIQDFTCRCLEVEWEQRFEDLTALLKDLDPATTIIVCESFRLYPEAAKGQAQIRSDFPSVQVIGLIQAFAHMGGFSPVVFQQPAMRKSVRILKWHVPIVGRSLHQQDAYRHARYYIVTNLRRTP